MITQKEKLLACLSFIAPLFHYLWFLSNLPSQNIWIIPITSIIISLIFLLIGKQSKYIQNSAKKSFLFQLFLSFFYLIMFLFGSNGLMFGVFVAFQPIWIISMLVIGLKKL